MKMWNWLKSAGTGTGSNPVFDGKVLAVLLSVIMAMSLFLAGCGQIPVLPGSSGDGNPAGEEAAGNGNPAGAEAAGNGNPAGAEAAGNGNPAGAEAAGNGNLAGADADGNGSLIDADGSDGRNGNSVEISGTEEIPLDEPAAPPEGWEAVEYRDLFEVEVYDAAVYPYTREYSFDVDVALDHFQYYPGEMVEKGSVLVYGDMEGIDESIEQLEEQIETMEEDYLKYKAEVEESLIEPEADERRLAGILETLERTAPPMYQTSEGMQPGETGVVSSGDAGDLLDSAEPEVSEEYQKWQEEYHYFEGRYRIVGHQNNVARKGLEDRTQLYELDHAYLLGRLKKLKEQRRKYILTSDMAGEIVAVSLKEKGSRIAKSEAVVAVGDNSRKLIKCEYLSDSMIQAAKDVYAIIGGARYEVDYQKLSNTEYNTLSARNETMISTFGILGDTEAVSVGDYAVIVLVKNSRDAVLTIPNAAIHRDTSGRYVYVRKPEGNEILYITTGMTDNAYTEVLSGLEPGDQVLVSEPTTAGPQRVTLEKGTYSSYFNGNGNFYYPIAYYAENPVVYGDPFFVEFQAQLYQYVEKGDVIATIRVRGDNVALARNRLNLQRQKERLEEWMEENEDAEPEELEERREPILELEELISDMEKDYGTTVVTAPHAGIITWLAEYQEGDALAREAALCEIADVEHSYVLLENRGLLNYGNSVLVHYRDREGEDQQAESLVVSLSGNGTSNALRTSYSLVQIPPEAVDEIVATARQGDFWNRQGLFRVEAQVQEMENVLLVPRSAVKTIQMMPYVKVAGADGEIISRSIVVGGGDSSTYWIVDGLTEGMELCLE